MDTIATLGFANVARVAAGMTDASAANGWNATRSVWESVADSETAAVRYWMDVHAESPTEAYSEVIEALESVGKTVSDVARVMA